MNLRLRRTHHIAAGVFGELFDESGHLVCYTLEHSYESSDLGGHHVAKLPVGTYTCRRGDHRLHSGPIVTFEVMGVPGHKGILFHCGNAEDDSEGCILVGLEQHTKNGELVSIGKSRAAFEEFMDLEAGVNEFSLTVEVA